MKKQNGMSMIILIILIGIIIAVATGIIYYIKNVIEESHLQDLKTNMLIMQAEAKKGLEEVCFQTANLDESKADDLEKINQVKQENLAGIAWVNVNEEIKESVKQLPEEIVIDDNCYYLDNETLNKMGIDESIIEKYKYFIVKYDFENVTLEIILTEGYEGNYTLTQINELSTNAVELIQRDGE